MAQPGDTITYTYSGAQETEDVSSIDQIQINYIDGGGGVADSDKPGTAGGRIEDVVVDVSSYSEIYIWVAGTEGFGRYEGNTNDNPGGGSTEVSLSSTDASDSATEPALAGAGGGGGGFSDGQFFRLAGGDGARRGAGDAGTSEGTPPPLGGLGAKLDQDATVGDGAIDVHAGNTDKNTISRSDIISKGANFAITPGGGSPEGTQEGEIQIVFSESQAPAAPSNLQLSLQ